MSLDLRLVFVICTGCLGPPELGSDLLQLIVPQVSWDLRWYVYEGSLLIFLKRQKGFLGALGQWLKVYYHFSCAFNFFHSFCEAMKKNDL